MKQIPYFDELLSPEYYHEIQGFESRLAALKLNDVRETLGDCMTSLIYSDSEEQKNINDEFEKNVIRRFHIRHAIIDLNNCFDLLLQVPWFFYRVWEHYNKGGKYYDSKNIHNYDVFRNTANWVESAEKACTYYKLEKFLRKNSDISLNDMATIFRSFKDTYVYNEKKPFTVRTIANAIKHNGTLKIKELQKPWDFNLNINGEDFNPHAHNLGVEIRSKFYSMESSNNSILGEIRLNYSDDLYIDIEYNNGEIFLGKDYVRNNKHYSIDELHKEAVGYYDSFIELFKIVYENINKYLSKSPVMKIERCNKSSNSINLDKYFKIIE